jgi:hypothetical protein
MRSRLKQVSIVANLTWFLHIGQKALIGSNMGGILFLKNRRKCAR